MSIRYIFRSVEVDRCLSGTVDHPDVYARFDKKGDHSTFSIIWDKVFNVEHVRVSYDEKGCKEFYNQIIESNNRGFQLPHGAFDADQFAEAFEAIRRKKSELGIPFDCDYLRT